MSPLKRSAPGISETDMQCRARAMPMAVRRIARSPGPRTNDTNMSHVTALMSNATLYTAGARTPSAKLRPAMGDNHAHMASTGNRLCAVQIYSERKRVQNLQRAAVYSEGW